MNHYIERGREIVKKSPELFIDIDVEADGVAGQGSLLSLGAVDPWGDTFYREIQPVEANGFIPDYREFTDTHGMEHDRLLREGAPIGQTLVEFADWAKERQAVHEKAGAIALVGFNASYDYPLVNLEYIRANIESPFGIAGYCVKSLAMALNREDYSWKQTGKSRLPKELLPEEEFTHHDLDDARYQQAIHYGLIGMLRN